MPVPKTEREAELIRLVSHDEVEDVFHGSNFGKNSKPRDIIADSLLKIAGGFSTGNTAMCICRELKLIGIVHFKA